MGLAKHLAMNAVQVQAFLDLGDDVAVPREVEHFAFFRTRRAAARAAADLTALGYDTTLRRARVLEVELRAAKTSPVTAAAAEAFTREVYDLVGRHGGDYEGWGATVA